MSASKDPIIEAERRRKISETLSQRNVGENHPFYGKHHSEATKKKMSEAQIGEKNHYFGKKHSDETREKMRKSQMGKHGVV